MTLNRAESGEVSVRVQVYRDGELLENAQGASDINEFVVGIELYESISSATLEAKLVIQDNAGLINQFTGSELFKISITGSVYDNTYFMRAYNIESRSKINQTSDVFIMNLTSDEYIRNEVSNVFGNSEVIFKETSAKKIIETIIKSNLYLNSKKRVYVEQSLNKHQFVIPNWRPFDCIYWLCSRSIRNNSPGKNLQGGYVFFENRIGYHFKSVDQMIDDVNNQSADTETNPNGTESSAKVRLYKYEYTPKNTSENKILEQFKIESITFPEEKNFLMGLRHGTWSGFSIGLDPVTVSSSKMGVSTDLAADAYRYSIKESWGKMSHLKGGKNKNPIEKMDKGIQDMIDYPKRVRYTILPNQIFDPKYSTNPQKNYEQLVELQAYQWMRIESIKNVKLQIVVPGNLDLYAGYGIEVIIPSTARSGKTTKIDKRYSGRYLIAGVSHKIVNNNMATELLLLKDSIQ
ncbi:hypothetical protein Syn7803C76_10 [Synechococcus phage ACG-2014b]|uniref:Uncharacterized protein n=2 Tax=Synechococcus phage ACG-2014b TaxID=1493508 RepID=A0A0E3HTW9_9CAUD|nr:tail protein [Synechococcus phage ACG-2014b]YP_009779639.1 tail protein [Synechococcus phage ACG-2014b]YP_009779853.1 tail protein [Synechococcus phage ACG-2014b]AIX17233.1 hypothetical protein Syn7803C61_11 [Synechococcus phage ACG-2014b]AIX17447.1 hypothetical protein Syn7803C66_10 [Synechococcus phage ACG-2014b]AIX17662.1 hypothetical protein Syn7803C67_10 [Synechococcus phage ACG-2014b]AIX17879.1 hypothetical protein Syn7803C68_11 [Synechococcus phage ACG-2014b]AIX18094.1 hypothetical